MRDYRLYLKDILAAMESIEAFVAGMDSGTSTERNPRRELQI
jgi:uncharacterized protein with HEPN domain